MRDNRLLTGTGRRSYLAWANRRRVFFTRHTTEMPCIRPTTAARDFRAQPAYAVVVAALFVAFMASGCRQPRVEAPGNMSTVDSAAPAGATDTVRGILQRVGNDPLSVLILSSSAGDTVFAVRGALLVQLNRAVGLEVMLAGTRSSTRDYSASPRGAMVFQVAQFFVRRADGQIAVDGVLNRRDGKYFLVTTLGERKEVAYLPQELRGQVGSWVFLVGALDKAPSAYGILSERK